MIQFNEEISFSLILVMFIYGAIDDFYQKIVPYFSKSELFFLYVYEIRYCNNYFEANSVPSYPQSRPLIPCGPAADSQTIIAIAS